MSTTKYLDIDAVCKRINKSKSTVYTLIRQGGFPSPVRLTPSAVRWKAMDVDRWLIQQLTEGDRATRWLPMPWHFAKRNSGRR